MARYTALPNEVAHLIDLGRDISNLALSRIEQVRLVMRNGSSLEGRITAQGGGNNGGERGSWTYCGSVTIADSSGRESTIDLLDIARVEPAIQA